MANEKAGSVENHDGGVPVCAPEKIGSVEIHGVAQCAAIVAHEVEYNPYSLGIDPTGESGEPHEAALVEIAGSLFDGSPEEIAVVGTEALAILLDVDEALERARFWYSLRYVS